MGCIKHSFAFFGELVRAFSLSSCSGELGFSMANPTLYHEKQWLQRCAVHTINNLFQREEVDASELDQIANNLSPGAFFCPHKSVWGTGNYDVNVILAALTTRDKVCRWWDRRKDLNHLPFEATMGLIVNRASSRLGGLWKSKHWYAITIISGEFYNCNSTLSKPRKVSKEELLQILEKEIQGGGEIIRVLNEEVEDPEFPMKNDKE